MKKADNQKTERQTSNAEPRTPTERSITMTRQIRDSGRYRASRRFAADPLAFGYLLRAVAATDRLLLVPTRCQHHSVARICSDTTSRGRTVVAWQGMGCC